MALRVAFLGSPAFAVPSLQGLAAAHDVLAVVTQPDRPGGRGLRPEPTAVRRAATALGLPVHTYAPAARRDIETQLASFGLDVLVVVAFGAILRRSTWETARRGAVNVHASLLPRWRGLAPIERALLAGDAVTGVSLMCIDAGVDTGPVLAQRLVPIAAADTRLTLAPKLAETGAALLVERLGDYVAGALQPVPQEEAGACYAPRLAKHEGELDWRAAATVLERQVRALAGWPGTTTRAGGQPLKVHGLRVVTAAAPLAAPGTIVQADARSGVHVACGEGAVELLEVQLAGKPRRPATALVHGRVLCTGMVLGGDTEVDE